MTDIATLLKEPVAEAKMVICGGGHVALQVVKLAKLCGFRVTVLEDRPEFGEKARNAGADEVQCGDFVSLLEALQSDEDTFFVVLTRGHKYDRDCMAAAIKKPHAYLGMIGSKRKVGIVHEALVKEGVTEEEWREVHAPIGLQIAAETPEEIAVSILGEIIQVKNTNGHDYGMTKEVMNALRHLHADPDSEKRAVLATITKKTGSAPRGAGARMIVYEDGTITGTIGGGKGEADVITDAVSFMGEGKDEAEKRVKVVMTSDAAAQDGLVCGGEIEVLLEIL